MMKKIRTIIVEDEKPNYEYLQLMLNKHFTEIEIVSIINNIPEAIVEVRQQNPDLIFLDIELLPNYGFELLEMTRGMKYHTIFTTHFNKYATKAFRYAAIHYLEKPFGLDDLEEAINFYKERTGYTENNKDLKVDELGKRAEDILLHNLKETNENQIIRFPIYGGTEFIFIKEILWCQAESNYTYIQRTDKKSTKVTKTLKHVEAMLKGHNFYRVHSSYLVNLDHMKMYLRGDGGEVVMADDHHVPVARNRKKGFLKKLGNSG
ncbi:MAG: LytTR family DNA-binding domain-containing protein [Bacteroidota bacterium]